MGTITNNKEILGVLPKQTNTTQIEWTSNLKGDVVTNVSNLLWEEVLKYDKSLQEEAKMFNDERTPFDKIFGINNISYIDLAREDAIKENHIRIGNADKGKEYVETLIARRNELEFGTHFLTEKEDENLTILQRKIKVRLKAWIWSYKKGDAVDAVMHLYSSTKYSTPNTLQSKLAKNAGSELMEKLRELRQNQPDEPTNEDYDLYPIEELKTKTGECYKYWNEQVIPALIEVLRKSKKF